MFRLLAIPFGILVCLVFPLSAADTQDGLSPTAQKLVQLSKAGVDESVIVAFIQTQTAPSAVSSADVELMKAAGVSPTVLAAVVNHNSPQVAVQPVAGPLTEAQLYRLYYGYIYHEGGAYNISGGLPSMMKLDLESDARAGSYIRTYDSESGNARLLNWGGLGLVFSGLLYSGISYAVAPNNGDINNTIGFSAVGVGVLATVIGNILNVAAYQNLYDGLFQYNRDLVNRASGGNP